MPRGRGRPTARLPRCCRARAPIFQDLRAMPRYSHASPGFANRRFPAACPRPELPAPVGGWWGRQDSNLRRHSQRIYSPPPLPLGTLPQSRRTVLISKDNRVRPPVRWLRSYAGATPAKSMERPRASSKTKKAAGGSGGFLVRPRVELRVTDPAQLRGQYGKTVPPPA